MASEALLSCAIQPSFLEIPAFGGAAAGPLLWPLGCGRAGESAQLITLPAGPVIPLGARGSVVIRPRCLAWRWRMVIARTSRNVPPAVLLWLRPQLRSWDQLGEADQSGGRSGWRSIAHSAWRPRCCDPASPRTEAALHPPWRSACQGPPALWSRRAVRRSRGS